MSKKTNTSSLTEAAMVCGILVIFSVLSRYFFSLIDFLFPIPIILLCKRRDIKYATLSAVSASIIANILIGIEFGYMYLVFYTPLAIVMSYLIKKEKKPATVIIGGAIATIIVIIISIYAFQLFTGINFADELSKTINTYIDSYNTELNSILSGTENYKQVLEQITEISNILGLVLNMVIPSAFIAVAFALSYIWYTISYLLGKKLKIELKPIQDISMFRLPKSYVIGTSIMFIMAFILDSFGFPNSDALLANITILISLSYLIQGLGVVKYIMIKARAKRIVILIVFILVFLVQFLLGGVVFLGFMDMIMDFRGLRNKK